MIPLPRSIPFLMRAGGDTDGGTISTGNWTEKGDGAAPTKEWDITDDRVTD